MQSKVSGQQPLVSVRGLHHTYGTTHTIKGVDLDLYPGEVIVIMGPSGSGKSTFLRCLTFLEPSAAGSITVADVRVDAAASRNDWSDAVRAVRRRAAMVFQDFNLFAHKTVLENVIEGAVVVRRVPRAQAVARGESELDKMGLLKRRDAYPAQLASGEQQRVAIARSLCMDPDVLLFDDPTSALDPPLVGELVITIRRLVEEGAGILIVSNEPYLARQVADDVILMVDGVWAERAPAEQFFVQPTHEATRRFLEQIMLKGIAGA